tara:strand:+ start:447 stop:1640 length:1194 start_codon:yes stop_codon:yes gene_type:complete
MKELEIIGRKNSLFSQDILDNKEFLENEISSSSFLVIGGAGTIGKAVTKEIFKHDPRKLHVVDISENNLVELVRDIRSSIGYGSGEFQVFALDCGSQIFEKMFHTFGDYDYVFNLSALKHVRSEKDPFTLHRMIEVNILNSIKVVNLAKKFDVKKYFSVSTDKAANPANMMGASKKIMEMFLMEESACQNISMARFANVAFSDGSLLFSFRQRLLKNQPISAPSDIKRYFISPKESGQLCLFSALQGENRDIYFPKLEKKLHLQKFPEIAERFLYLNGFEAVSCDSEDEARGKVNELRKQKKWPCYFFKSNTTGEKLFEEFYTKKEKLNFQQYKEIGIIKNGAYKPNPSLNKFLTDYEELLGLKILTKEKILNMFFSVLPEFKKTYVSKNKDLNQIM